MVWRHQQRLWKKNTVEPKRTDIVFGGAENRDATAVDLVVVDPLLVVSKKHNLYPIGEVVYEAHSNMKDMKK